LDIPNLYNFFEESSEVYMNNIFFHPKNYIDVKQMEIKRNKYTIKIMRVKYIVFFDEEII
jgi:hypothetical protein